MNQQAEDAVTAMLNCFPQTAQDYRLLFESLDGLCDGISDRAIIETAGRFAAGDVPEQSRKFAPSTAEFVQAARKQDDFIAVRNRPQIAPPSYRPGPLAPFQIARQKAFANNSHRPVIAHDVTLEQFQAMSRAGQLPVGASWVACLATIYGPEPKRQSIAAE